MSRKGLRDVRAPSPQLLQPLARVEARQLHLLLHEFDCCRLWVSRVPRFFQGTRPFDVNRHIGMAPNERNDLVHGVEHVRRIRRTHLKGVFVFGPSGCPLSGRQRAQGSLRIAHERFDRLVGQGLQRAGRLVSERHTARQRQHEQRQPAAHLHQMPFKDTYI